MFHSAIFINKIKFRVNVGEMLKIELLLAAEYDINIVTLTLTPSWEFFNESVFAFIVLVQVLVQALGTYWLLM